MNKLLLLCLPFFLYAQNIHYGVHDKHAYTLTQGEHQLLAESLQMNDTLDILGLKDREFANANLGAIGDLSGYGFEYRYGIFKDLMVSYKQSTFDIDYGMGTLSNKKQEAYLRYNFANSAFSIINALSFDIGYKSNKADDMNGMRVPVTSSYINNQENIDQIYDQYDIQEINFGTIDNIHYVQILQNNGNGFETILNKLPSIQNILGLIKEPSISLKNLQDTTWYVNLLFEKHLSENFLFSSYIQYGQSNINSLVHINVEPIDEIQDILDTSFEKSFDLSRSETYIKMGFNVSTFFANLLWELNYEYSKILRGAGLEYVDFNHILHATLGRKLSENLLGFITAKYMYRQFNGEVPYLYNEYTQTTFDHNYGYVKFGLMYSF